MYKRILMVAATLLIVMSPVAHAEDPQSALMLSDAQITLIRANCRSVQATLTGIHSSDALSRVHLGQEYETISTKFMAPMNSRVALAKLDGVALTKTTVEFNKQLDEFRSLYQQYEQTMIRAMQMKCIDQPVAFYDTIVQARTHRAAVREKVVSLGNLIHDYRTDVDEVRTQAKESAGDN